MVTLEVDIPDEIGNDVKEIEHLSEKLAWFLTEQIKIQRWRKERYQAKTSDLVDAAFDEARSLSEQGMTAEQARLEFIEMWQTSPR